MSNLQYMDALKRAGEVRLGQKTVLRAVAERRQSIEGALDDPHAAGVTVYKLLVSQHRWGRTRVLRALYETNELLWPKHAPLVFCFPEGKRLGELTGREKTALVRACAAKREAT